MAYGNKYRIQYYDWFGDQTIIFISERDYSGVVTELEPAADPLTISLKADNNDIFSPIKQTSAQINVISETDFQLLDLFSSDSKKFRVEVNKGSWLMDGGKGVFTSGTESWIKWGNNTITNDAGALKVTYVDTSNGAYTYLRGTSDINTNLTIGQTYKIYVRAKVNTGSVDLYLTGPGTTIASVTATDFTWYSITFVATSEDTDHLDVKSMGAGEICWIDEWYVYEYNPTWWGYLISDQYQEPYLQPKYAVTLYATDGLGWLKSLPFTELEVLISGYQSLSDVLLLTLYDKLDFTLDIYENIDTYEDNIDQTAADSVLDQIYVDFTKFNKFYTDYSCWDVLEWMLKSYNAYLIQTGGAWNIIQIPTNRASYTRRKWVFSSGFYSYDSNAAYDPVVATTSTDVAQASLVRLVGNTLTMSPGWRGFSMNQDYSPLTQLTEGGNFPYEDFTLSGTWSNANWTMSGVLTIQPKFTGTPVEAAARSIRINNITGDTNISNYVYFDRYMNRTKFNFSTDVINQPFQGDTGMEIVTTSTTIGAAAYVYQDIEIENSADDLIFRFKYGMIEIPNSWIVYMEVSITGGPADWWLDNDAVWQGSQRHISFAGAAGRDIMEEREIRVATIQKGTLRIKLYELVTSGVVNDFVYHEVYMYYLPAGVGLYNSKIRNVVIDNANNYTPAKIEMVYGDAPDHDNNELCYGTALYYDTPKVCTGAWETSQELIDIASNTIAHQYSVPRQTITGTIYSKLIDWASIIQEINNSNRKFMINMGSYNDRNGAWNVTLCQLISTQNKISSWTNTSWTTFTKTGIDIASAINGAGAASAYTNIIGNSVGSRFALRWEADAVDADGYFSIGGVDTYITTTVGTRLITCIASGSKAYFEMDTGDTGTFTNITFYLYSY